MITKETTLKLHPIQNKVAIRVHRGVMCDTIEYAINEEVKSCQNRKENWATFMRMVQDPTINIVCEIFEGNEVVESMPFQDSPPYIHRNSNGTIKRR
jgi:hypothetical protein|tara:strand:+ start:4381 stop:4671 length:291 start_codon:yes stop_codon:yes gene_type:complete